MAVGAEVTFYCREHNSAETVRSSPGDGRCQPLSSAGISVLRDRKNISNKSERYYCQCTNGPRKNSVLNK